MARWMGVAALLLVLSVALPARAGDVEDCTWPEPMTTLLKSNADKVLAACRRLADEGNANAQANLGFAYQNGGGVPQSYEAAAKWYRKAADQGHVIAQVNLGILYQRGLGLTQDYGQAYFWFTLSGGRDYGAAILRDVVAAKMTPAQIEKIQLRVAEWKPESQGVVQDSADPKEEFRKAAEHGNPEAQYELGRRYAMDGSFYAAKDWYIRAANQGNAEAMYGLGILYFGGRVGALDYVQAYKWYSLAAARGHADGATEMVAAKMTPSQIAQAKALAAAWKPTRAQ